MYPPEHYSITFKSYYMTWEHILLLYEHVFLSRLEAKG